MRSQERLSKRPRVRLVSGRTLRLGTRAVVSHRRGRYPILAGAAMIGASAGWVAWSTGALRMVLVPHAITDSCGLRAARTIWVSPPPRFPADRSES